MKDAYHIKTSPLISSANQWTDFYVIRTSVVNELRVKGEEEVLSPTISKNDYRTVISTLPSMFSQFAEAAVPRCSSKEVFLQILQHSQENNCA